MRIQSLMSRDVRLGRLLESIRIVSQETVSLPPLMFSFSIASQRTAEWGNYTISQNQIEHTIKLPAKLVPLFHTRKRKNVMTGGL